MTEISKKLLTPIEEPYKFHVHLDTRHRLPERVVEILLENGFSGSCPVFSCAVASSGQNPNAEVTYETYKDAAPETWTLKCNQRATSERAYEIVTGILKNKEWEIQGYAEREIVFRDSAFMPKEFDEEAYERLVRKSDVKVFQRHPLIMGELEKPSMEFHLTINPDYCDARLMWLLDAMGLLGYEISKALYNKEGEPVLDNGQHVIVRERPLTIRHSDRSETPEEDFFQLVGLVLHIMTKIGGISEGIKLPDGSEYFPATFKIEKLVEFDPYRISSDQIPPIMASAIFDKVNEIGFEVPDSIRTVGLLMDRLGLKGGGSLER